MSSGNRSITKYPGAAGHSSSRGKSAAGRSFIQPEKIPADPAPERHKRGKRRPDNAGGAFHLCVPGGFSQSIMAVALLTIISAPRAWSPDPDTRPFAKTV